MNSTCSIAECLFGKCLKRFPFVGAGLVLGLASLFAAPAAHADKVGVAAAVKPDAYNVLAGGQRRQITIGKSIFFNEHINTSGKGLVQVLLLDGSTFTVGPGSDLVIDKFVYNPKKNEGQVVASFSKGVLRFVGGKISKHDNGVTVNTPSGALTIRGGIFQGYIGHGKTEFSFLYGIQMKLIGHNGHIWRVYQPGYTLDLTGGNPVIRPTGPNDTFLFLNALRGRGRFYAHGHGRNRQAGNRYGGGTGQQSSNNTTGDSFGINNLITQAITNQIRNQIENNPEGPGCPWFHHWHHHHSWGSFGSEESSFFHHGLPTDASPQ